MSDPTAQLKSAATAVEQSLLTSIMANKTLSVVLVVVCFIIGFAAGHFL
jgi:hypothetical protein